MVRCKRTAVVREPSAQCISSANVQTHGFADGTGRYNAARYARSVECANLDEARGCISPYSRHTFAERQLRIVTRTNKTHRTREGLVIWPISTNEVAEGSSGRLGTCIQMRFHLGDVRRSILHFRQAEVLVAICRRPWSGVIKGDKAGYVVRRECS